MIVLLVNSVLTDMQESLVPMGKNVSMGIVRLAPKGKNVTEKPNPIAPRIKNVLAVFNPIAAHTNNAAVATLPIMMEQKIFAWRENYAKMDKKNLVLLASIAQTAKPL